MEFSQKLTEKWKPVLDHEDLPDTAHRESAADARCGRRQSDAEKASAGDDAIAFAPSPHRATRPASRVCLACVSRGRSHADRPPQRTTSCSLFSAGVVVATSWSALSSIP